LINKKREEEEDRPKNYQWMKLNTVLFQILTQVTQLHTTNHLLCTPMI